MDIIITVMCNCKSPIQLISPNNKHEINHNYFISQLTEVDPEFWKRGQNMSILLLNLFMMAHLFRILDCESQKVICITNHFIIIQHWIMFNCRFFATNIYITLIGSSYINDTVKQNVTNRQVNHYWVRFTWHIQYNWHLKGDQSLAELRQDNL